ncbi:hypothetical protein DMN57_15370 [Escherichia coli]|nr:hypothetical protein [Escherichia coli]
MVTNCTYDGVCYNAKEAQDLLEKPPIVCTLTKPVRLCTFQPDLCRSLCHARRTRRSQRSYRFRHPLHPQTAECAVTGLLYSCT